MFNLGDAGYDRTLMYSPDGRVIQVEYAREAVRRGNSIIAIKVKDGIVMLAESRSHSKLFEPTEKISQIDDNIYVTFSGLLADSRVLINEARVFAQINKITYGEECDVETIAWHISKIAQQITQFGGRPFGLTLIIGGISNSEPQLNVVEPSGAKFEVKAIAIGRNDDALMKYLESHYKEDLSLEDAKAMAVKGFSEVNPDKNNYELMVMDLKTQKIDRTLVTPS
jgi:proteasome alpha subunit